MFFGVLSEGLSGCGTLDSLAHASSKHILNAQVAIRAPCCRKFFDVRIVYVLMQCPQCHAETQSHPLVKTMELAFLCKNCRRAFRKDMAQYEQEDEYCPHCDNHYVSKAMLMAR